MSLRIRSHVRRERGGAEIASIVDHHWNFYTRDYSDIHIHCDPRRYRNTDPQIAINEC